MSEIYEVDCPHCGERTMADVEPRESGLIPKIKNTCQECGKDFFTTTTIDIGVTIN